MSLPNNLGRLAAGLTADASLNIGVGVTPSGTYKFQVNGGGFLSGSITADDLILTAGTLFGAGNTGFSNRLSDTTLYLQMPASGFNITDNALNTKVIISSTGAATFYGAITSTLSSGIFLNNGSAGTNASQIRINNTSGDARFGIESSTGGTIQVGTSPYAVVLGNQANNALQFTTNGTARMTILGTGNVGIGTSGPIAKLNVFGTSGNPSTTADTYNLFSITGNLGPQLNIGGYNGASYGMWMQVKDAGNGGTLYPILLQPLGGNVGIGTTSPVSLLTVATGNVTNAGQWNSSAIALYNPTNVGAYSQISFGYTTSTTNASAYIGYISTNQASNGFGDLVFGTRNVSTDTQPTERMRITSGGSINFNGTDATTQYYFGYNRPTATNLLVNGGNNNKIRIQNVESDIVVLNSNGNSYFNGGNVGIKNTSPSGLLEVGIVNNNSTYGGHFFSTFQIPVDTWSTMFYVPSNNQWNAITEFTWTSSGDYNRSGAAYMRWAYEAGAATLGVVYTLYNNSQNATATFRKSGNEIQIFITGGSANYYVQTRIQGSKAQ